VKRFYKDWYRPNQQALIVVGDIDATSIEQQVKKLFGDLKNPAKQRPVLPYNIPLSGKNQFLALTDHEQTATEISVLIKMTELSLKTAADYRVSIVRSLVNYVLAARLQELSTQPESPFVSADAGVSGFMGGLDAFKVSIAPKPGEIKEAFTTVWKEIVRIQQNGITGNELERSKLSYISQMENVYKERGKNPSKSYVQEYLQLYLHGIAAPGIEKEYALAKEYSSNISIEEVNGCIRAILKDKDRDIIIVAPEKDKDALPDQARVNAWITIISEDKLAQWKEEAPVNGLMTTMPAPGKVISRERADSLGVTILTLSNGVKVWLKPTQFKNEEVVFGAFSEGGTSLYPDSMYMNASGAANLIAANGLGAFTPVDLSKMLAGKSVQVQPYIQERYEGINGAATPKDLETALQLTWLYFTKPRNDASLFSNNISRMKAGMANRGNSPDAAFSDTANLVLGGYHYRRQPLTAERLDSIDADKAYAIYKERFANAADFTFVFTGSIDTTTFIPLIERYLGSLPAGGKNETAKDLGIHIPEGPINKIVNKGKDNKAVVRLLYSGIYSFSEANNIQLTALGTVLQYRMTERIRELEGGAYSPRAGASYNKLPQSRYGISIQFICAPGNIDKLVAAVNDEISKIKNGGVTADDISKFTAEQTRTTELKLQSNQFWFGYLMYALQNNEPPTGIFQFKEVLKTVTPKTVQQAAQRYISDNNCVMLVLQPES